MTTESRLKRKIADRMPEPDKAETLALVDQLVREKDQEVYRESERGIASVKQFREAVEKQFKH